MKIAKKLLLPGVFLAVLSSCHPDESYKCYLVEYPLGTDEGDTLDWYNEGFWVTNKQSKPDAACEEDRIWYDSTNQILNPSYYCLCQCGWEPD